MKIQLLSLVIKNVESRLKALVHSALEAHDAATNSESKAENKYDTRGLEASYLAGAQSKRAKKLEESLYYLKKISENDLAEKHTQVKLYSIVKIIDENETKKSFFILPVEGGVQIEVDNKKYQVITLSSPIGKSMFKKQEGDEVSLNTGGMSKYFDIESIY